MLLEASRRALAEKGTIWDVWATHAASVPDAEAIAHWERGVCTHRWTWRELHARALHYSAALARYGIKPGQVCAVILRHNAELYPLYMGIVACGAVPSVLAYPNPRLHPDKFRSGLVGMASHSGLDWVLTERSLGGAIRPLVTGKELPIKGVIHPFELQASTTDARVALRLPEDAALLQHSSGTTGLQKAVTISHRALLEHVVRYSASIGLREDDKVVSWLPLYHDMGLIAAFHLPLASGIASVQIDPFEWVTSPGLLLQAVSSEEGTLTWLPNFAYNLMADRVPAEDVAGVSLAKLRLAVNCSERVRKTSHDRFARRYAKHGLSRNALGASYAMAEATFAVTQTPPGSQARELGLSREALARGVVQVAQGTEPTVWCVSSGRPISGCTVEVVGESGNSLPPDRVGELTIRSASLFDGYRNLPQKTLEVLQGDRYLTGDIGFIYEGECFVIGRKKDILIVAGKNIYPEDIEDIVGLVESVLPGRVVAFSIDDEDAGTEAVCVVCETSAPQEQYRKISRKIRAASDVAISRVYLAPPRWLIKSSAGKPSRRANRDRALVELKDSLQS